MQTHKEEITKPISKNGTSGKRSKSRTLFKCNRKRKIRALSSILNDVRASILDKMSISGFDICRNLGIDQAFTNVQLADLQILYNGYCTLRNHSHEAALKIPECKTIEELLKELHPLFTLYLKSENYTTGFLPHTNSIDSDDTEEPCVFHLTLTDPIGFSCLNIDLVETHPLRIRNVIREAFKLLTLMNIENIYKLPLNDMLLSDYEQMSDMIKDLCDTDEMSPMTDEAIYKVMRDLEIVRSKELPLIEEFCDIQFKNRISNYIKKHNDDLSKWLSAIRSLRAQGFSINEYSFYSEDTNVALLDVLTIGYSGSSMFNEIAYKQCESYTECTYAETGVYTYGFVSKHGATPYIENNFSELLEQVFRFNLKTLSYD